MRNDIIFFCADVVSDCHLFADLYLRTDFAIKNVLTAEQKAQLEQLKNQRPEFSRGDRSRMPSPAQN